MILYVTPSLYSFQNTLRLPIGTEDDTFETIKEAQKRRSLEYLIDRIEASPIGQVVFGRRKDGELFLAFISHKALKKLEELRTMACQLKYKKYEIGAFGVGKASFDSTIVFIQDVIIPRSIVTYEKESGFWTKEQFEIMAIDHDIYSDPNTIYYTERYQEFVKEFGEIVFEAHSHIPLQFSPIRKLATDDRIFLARRAIPDSEDIDTQRRDRIPVGGIILEAKVSIYHVDQKGVSTMQNKITRDLEAITSILEELRAKMFNLDEITVIKQWAVDDGGLTGFHHQDIITGGPREGDDAGKKRLIRDFFEGRFKSFLRNWRWL